jgi:hypothetical protein
MTLWLRTALLIAAVSLVAACGSDARSGSTDDPPSAADEPIASTATTGSATSESLAPEETNGVDPVVTDRVVPTPQPPASRIYEGNGYPPELESLVAAAVNDLAGRLGVGFDSIRIATVEEVVWPNGGLGCPQPDMKYTQIPVDGLRITLVHDDLAYVYHSGGSAGPLLCLPNAAKGTGESTTQHTLPLPGDSDSDGAALQTEDSNPPKESAPTDQAGGPGGEPDV